MTRPALTRLVDFLMGKPSEQTQAATPTAAPASSVDAPAPKRRKLKAKRRVNRGSIGLNPDAPLLEQVRQVIHGKR